MVLSITTSKSDTTGTISICNLNLVSVEECSTSYSALLYPTREKTTTLSRVEVNESENCPLELAVTAEVLPSRYTITSDKGSSDDRSTNSPSTVMVPGPLAAGMNIKKTNNKYR